MVPPIGQNWWVSAVAATSTVAGHSPTGPWCASRRGDARIDLTIKLIGTAAEESGGGTVLAQRTGVFGDVATVMTVGSAASRSGARRLPVRTTSARVPQARVWSTAEAGAVATGCAHEVPLVLPAHTEFVPEVRTAETHRCAVIGLGRSPLRPENERAQQAGGADLGNVTRALPVASPRTALAAAGRRQRRRVGGAARRGRSPGKYG